MPWSSIHGTNWTTETVEPDRDRVCLPVIIDDPVFARDREVHVFVVAHPAKLQKQADGTYPVPTPYDVSGSAHWRNKADCALTVWRDLSTNANEIEVHIQKIRFREVGTLGKATLRYDKVSGRYS